MTWRGSTDVKDKIFAALVYLIPLFYALPYGQFLIAQFPALSIIEVPLIPIMLVYSILGPFAGILIFFVLFLAVVRNERISHFIRFNTMQAILIDIVLVLLGFLLQIMTRGLGVNILIETLYNIIFLATLAACIYSVVQSVRGHYAEIPTISEAVYSQVR